MAPTSIFQVSVEQFLPPFVCNIYLNRFEYSFHTPSDMLARGFDTFDSFEPEKVFLYSKTLADILLAAIF